MDVIGLGTVATDIVMQVDSLPKEDGFAVIKSSNYLPGGSGSNVIVQTSRLTAKCGFIAQTGDDAVGKDIRNSLRKEKVHTNAMPIKEGGVSVHTNIVVDNMGKKFILLNMGDAFLSMGSKDIDMQYIKTAKVLYTDLLPGEPAIAALKEAKKANIKTAFNMQVALPTMAGLGVPKADVLDSLKYVDVFAPCREGLYNITDTTDLVVSKDYIRKYFEGILLITLGSKGSVAFDSNDKMVEMPAINPTKTNKQIIDTTGAGDSYMGAFIYGYFLRGMDLKEAMYFATACAAYTCSGLGARSSPNIEQINQFLSEL